MAEGAKSEDHMDAEMTNVDNDDDDDDDDYGMIQNNIELQFKGAHTRPQTFPNAVQQTFKPSRLPFSHSSLHGFHSLIQGLQGSHSLIQDSLTSYCFVFTFWAPSLASRLPNMSFKLPDPTWVNLDSKLWPLVYGVNLSCSVCPPSC